MSEKIGWIDNLRAVACLMVIMIHTTTWYVNHASAVTEHVWDLANILNAFSRVCVPLFFMISGYLFFGERSVQGRHLLRIMLCLLFYSTVALVYIALLTPINEMLSLQKLLRKPVFYHLWFFFAIIPLYLLSPLIQVKVTSARYLAMVTLLLVLIANPHTQERWTGGFQWLPVNLTLSGDSFYYLLYALFGRAVGVMDTRRNGVSGLAMVLFMGSVTVIVLGTKKQMAINGAFDDTWYLYCGPAVFIAAVSLFVLFKNSINKRPLPLLATISRYSVPVYGFHALFIHYMRTHGLDNTQRPLIDIPFVFAITLCGSLLLSIILCRLDKRRWVS